MWFWCCILLFTSLATACVPGQYLQGTQCTSCSPGTFTVTADSTTCSQCSAGQFSTATGATSCQNCNATQFSPKSGSTTCNRCPANTGSYFASSACVSCITTAAPNPQLPCRMASGGICPNCSLACSACQPGYYGGGPTKCKNCPTGTFASVSQLTSVSDCSTCQIGTATRQTDTGASVCQTCTAVGRPLPKSSHSSAPGQTCRWECDMGVVRTYSSETNLNLGLLAFVYFSQGFFNLSAADVLNLYHRDTDYCCDSSVVGIGQWLFACTSTSNGIVINCVLPKNAEFFLQGDSKLNRCDDWQCKFGFYRIGSICANQPACRSGQTWKRDYDGNLITTTNGTFICTLCSTCLAGTETMNPCNATIDTICRRCGSTSYSLSGSACVSSVPLGYYPVRIQYSSQPVFQGRPTVNSDNSSITTWPQNMFLYTYTACAPIDHKLRYVNFHGGDPCSQTDSTSTTQCQTGTIACETECKPWNGTKGWFGQNSVCSDCVFDPTACYDNQFLSMSTCGPTLPPQCTQCPITPVPNANPFTNPRAISTGTPYPCAFTCVNQYVKSNTKSTCINCKPIPDGAAFDMSGCTWHCQQGYMLNATENGCEPCEPPPECVIGFYPDYDPNGQCMICQPCLAQVPNAQFISAGQPLGPTTCQIACDPGFWYSDNPLGCYVCNPDISCIAGQTYFIPCTTTSDAMCTPCSGCLPGKRTMFPCTPFTDVQCGNCNPSLLPPNASWGMECSWECNYGFVLEPPSFCRKCVAASECRINQQLTIPPNGCGRCDACPALIPGTQFIGDGQCGTEYVTGCDSRLYPMGATKTPQASTPVCPWICNTGFSLIPGDETTDLDKYIANYLLLSMPPQDQTTMTALFHRNTDACCNMSRVGVGKRLVGCSQTFAGTVQPCPPVNNSMFVFDGTVNKMDRCSDYTCKPGFFVINANEGCKPMPTCKGNQTLNRDTDGNLLFNSDNSLSCVPCSACLPGSQVLQPCNQSSDIVCQLCNPSTPFSAANGRCLPTPPLGFFPVAVRYDSMPTFQGRPFNSMWPNTLFTFTPCAPKTTNRQYAAWTGASCQRTIDNTTGCLNLTCPTECSQWNGKNGWYQSPTSAAACLPCVFNSTSCLSSQYVDMTVCGPVKPPACVFCNKTALPPNATQWKTPTDITFNTGPYQCDYSCLANFSKYNFTCVNCPFIPTNAILTQGCQWKCARGFTQSGSACVQCKAPTCALGSYVDFATPSSQCPECIACNPSVLFLDTVFTSPASCVFDCLPTYYSPAGVHPITKNPLGPCTYCNMDQLCTKDFYLAQCQSDADSTCAPCSQCDPGFRATVNCTQLSNTICGPCPFSLLPTGAIWAGELPCGWICPNGKTFIQSSFSCGHQVVTTLTSSRPATTTVRTQTTSSRPQATSSKPQTTQPPQQFVSLLSITIPISLKLTDILATAAVESQCVKPCVAQILSVTDPAGKVTLCQNNTCPSILNTRRLLASYGWIINLGFLSQIPLPPNPVISISQNTVTNFNTPVPAPQAAQLFQNPAQMLAYIASLQSTPPPPPQSSSSASSSSTVIIIVVVVVVVIVIVICVVCTVLYRKAKAQKHGYRKVINPRTIPVRIQRPIRVR